MTAYENVANATETAGGGSTALAAAPKKGTSKLKQKEHLTALAFISVKYVTDIIGQNSVKHWEDKLADARQGLSHYFNVLKERI